jgi:hypothetical protein
MSDRRTQTRRTALGLFVVVVVATAVFRFEAFFTEQLWLDDIQQRDAAFRGLDTDPLVEGLTLQNGLYWRLHFWSLSSIDNLVIIRIGYVLVYGLAALLAVRLLAGATRNLGLAGIVVALAFLNPATMLSFVFINGSSGAIFLALFFACIWCLTTTFSNTRMGLRSWGTQALFLIVALLAVMFASNGVPALLALLLLPWWRAPLLADRRSFRLHAAVSVLTIGLSTGFGALAMLSSHPYAAMEGRLTTDPVEVIDNGVRLLANVFVAYVDPFLFTGVPIGMVIGRWTAGLVFGTVALLVICASVRGLRMPQPSEQAAEIQQLQLVEILPFLLAAAAFSTASLALTRITHLWHYLVPSVFAVAACLIALRMLTSHRVALVLVMVIGSLTVLSFVEQNRVFGSSANQLANISSVLDQESASWSSPVQVFVVTTPPRGTWGSISQCEASPSFITRPDERTSTTPSLDHFPAHIVF